MPKKTEARVNIISTVATAPSAPVRATAGQARTDRRPAPLVPVQASVTSVGVDTFVENIGSTTDALRTIFADKFAEAFGDFKLDEVEVNLEISADGKVGFLGSSVGLKGSSSFKLTFKRQT